MTQAIFLFLVVAEVFKEEITPPEVTTYCYGTTTKQ
jgi:hypothetical protein